MIEFNTVTFAYPSGDEVLTEVSLAVKRGGLLGLAGANGSGKSTLLALMAGLYAPTRGKLEVAGRVSPGHEGDIRSVCRLVMQDADLQILGATVEEDLLLGRERGEAVTAEARAMAERLNLLKYWDRPVQTLSWGTKRKLCPATALLDRPRVLLLDEPFSGLDYPGVREMRALIRANREAGLTQVVSSHDLESFIDLVDGLAVLDNGELVLNGPAETVLDRVAEHSVRAPGSWTACRTIVPWDEGEAPMIDVAGPVRSLDPRLKLAAALLLGPCLWKVPVPAATGCAVFLLLLVRFLAAGQPGGGNMVRSLLSFVFFWVAVKLVLDGLSGVPAEFMARDAGQLAVRLVALLMLGLSLALFHFGPRPGVGRGPALRPFLGRDRAWRIALALSLMVHFLPACLSTLSGVREVAARRFPEAGFLRRMRMVPQAVIRNLGQKTWNQTLAVACRGLDRAGAWDPDFAWSGRDWFGSAFVLAAAGAMFFL